MIRRWAGRAHSAQPSTPDGSTTSSIGTLLIGRVIGMLLQFAAVVYAGKTIGPDGFGHLQVFLVLTLYLSLAGDLGLSIVGTRNAAMGVTHDLRPITIKRAWIGGALGITIVLMALVLPLSATDRGIGLCLAAGVVGTPLNLRWYLQGRGGVGTIAAADVSGAIITITAVLLLVRGPESVVPAALAFLCGPLAGSLVTTVASRHDLARSVAAPRPDRSLMRQAIPLGIAVLATQFYYGADSILLTWFRSAAEVGWYGAAYRIVLACLALPFAAHAIAMPALAALRTSSPERTEELLGTLTRGLLTIAVPLAVGGTITARVVMNLLFGGAFQPAEAPFSLLIWSCVTVSANAPFAALMLASHRDRRYAAITISGTVLNVVVNLVAIPAAGMYGAAVVTLATEVLVAGQILFATRDVALRILSPIVPRLLAATAIMALVVWPIRFSLLSIPVGVAVFIVGALLTGAIPIGDVRRLVDRVASSRSPEGD